MRSRSLVTMQQLCTMWAGSATIPNSRDLGFPARSSCCCMCRLSSRLTMCEFRFRSRATSLIVSVRHRRPTRLARLVVCCQTFEPIDVGAHTLRRPSGGTPPAAPRKHGRCIGRHRAYPGPWVRPCLGVAELCEDSRGPQPEPNPANQRIARIAPTARNDFEITNSLNALFCRQTSASAISDGWWLRLEARSRSTAPPGIRLDLVGPRKIVEPCASCRTDRAAASDEH